MPDLRFRRGRRRRRRPVLGGERCPLLFETATDCPKPILCEPGAFCERRNRRAQLGAKVENPQPPQVRQSVRIRRLEGNEIFFGGWAAKNCPGRFWDLEGVSETFSKNYLLPPTSMESLRIGQKVLKLDSRVFCLCMEKCPFPHPLFILPSHSLTPQWH